jgi:hypothetical protein
LKFTPTTRGFAALQQPLGAFFVAFEETIRPVLRPVKAILFGCFAGLVTERRSAAIAAAIVLPLSRFFDWKNGDFVEVTDAVRTGTREVKSHGWGF